MVILCGISTVGARTKYVCTHKLRNELCHFSDSAFELNAFLFAFKRASHDIKMNSKMHASNVKF